MIEFSNLSYETTVISPGGLECEIHDLPQDIRGDICYSVIGQVWPDSSDEYFPDGVPLIRSMDAYTFCEWFKPGRVLERECV